MAIPKLPPAAPIASPAADLNANPIIRRNNVAVTRSNRSGSPLGFVKSSGPMKKRLIVSLTGEDHSGKNHCAFTAPSPIYVHSFDPGIEGVIEKFHNKKDIYVANYELEIQPGEASPQVVAESADHIWQQFISNYRDGLASCGHGTTIIDTDTEAHQLIRLARLGKLSNVLPHMYGPVNAEFRCFLREGMGMPANIFFLSKYVDEWENITDSQGREKGRKTGNKVRKGFEELPFSMQVCGICERVDQPGGGSQFQITITDCRQDPACNGVTVPNDYDMLSLLVLGE